MVENLGNWLIIVVFSKGLLRYFVMVTLRSTVRLGVFGQFYRFFVSPDFNFLSRIDVKYPVCSWFIRLSNDNAQKNLWAISSWKKIHKVVSEFMLHIVWVRTPIEWVRTAIEICCKWILYGSTSFQDIGGVNSDTVKVLKIWIRQFGDILNQIIIFI